MHDGIDPRRPARAPRARLLAVATLATGVLAAGCGTATHTTTMMVVGGSATPVSTASSAGAAPRPAPGADGQLLALAKCMRSHGVPNFPDPLPGGNGFQVNPGLGLSAPAFNAARAQCQRFMPVLGGSGGPRFSERSLLKVRRAAVCMRQHGISQFPDPSTSRPSVSAMAGAREITDFDGAYLVFPSTLDMESPAYRRAASACGTLAGKLGRGPH